MPLFDIGSLLQENMPHAMQMSASSNTTRTFTKKQLLLCDNSISLVHLRTKNLKITGQLLCGVSFIHCP